MILEQLYQELNPFNAKLIAVSKTKPLEDIIKVYNQGQRHFGENRVQELESKYEELPKDIEWHMIGHLQSNKVKYIAPFVSLIHAVDKSSLLETINKEALKNKRTIDVLLQIKIADEESKFGLTISEALKIVSIYNQGKLNNVRIKGLMGMATFIQNMDQVRLEFKSLKNTFDKIKESIENHKQEFTELSMGMSGDYKIALEEGATMIRIGSMIFGQRY